MRTIQSSWHGFAAKTLPKPCSKIQHDEMQRAFYAGALSLMQIHIEVDGAELSEEAKIEIFEGLYTEATTFFENYISSGQNDKPQIITLGPK